MCLPIFSKLAAGELKAEFAPTASTGFLSTLIIDVCPRDKSVRESITLHCLRVVVPEQLNLMYGSSFREGLLNSCGPDGINMQYSVSDDKTGSFI
jgi:hypothetical protein